MRKLIALIAVLSLGMAGIAQADSIPTVRQYNQKMSPWTITVYNDYGSDIATGMAVTWDYTDSDLYTNYNPYVTVADASADSVTVAGIVVNSPCLANNMCEVAVWGPVTAICDDSTTTIDALDAVGYSGTNRGHLDEASATDNTRVVGWAMTDEGGTDGEECAIFLNLLGTAQAQ